MWKYRYLSAQPLRSQRITHALRSRVTKKRGDARGSIQQASQYARAFRVLEEREADDNFRRKRSSREQYCAWLFDRIKKQNVGDRVFECCSDVRSSSGTEEAGWTKRLDVNALIPDELEVTRVRRREQARVYSDPLETDQRFGCGTRIESTDGEDSDDAYYL